MSFKFFLSVCASFLVAKANGALLTVCYTNGGGLAATNFDPLLCTHIIHTFLQLDANGVIIDNGGATTSYLPSLVKLKEKNPSLKIMVAFGGAISGSNAAFSSMSANPTATQSFTQNVLKYMKDNKIDGVDLDWEYPESPDDKINFGLLVERMRSAFNSLTTKFLLTTALGASNWRAGVSYDLPKIFKSCDFVNIMSYDFNGWQWTGRVGHNAPLYGRPEDSGDQIGNNINAFMNGFLTTTGVVASKIIFGIPTYGKKFNLANSGNTAVYAPGTPAGDEEYNSICKKIKLNQYTSVLDNVQKAAYVYAGTTWVGYESPASAAVKAQYIKDKGFGGAMFWSLNGDDYANACGDGKSPIITKVNSIMNGGSSPNVPVVPIVTTTTTTTTTTKASGGSGGTFVCPGNGLFKNPSDCSSFYNCWAGIAALTVCPSGLRFNSAATVCDWPANVVC